MIPSLAQTSSEDLKLDDDCPTSIVNERRFFLFGFIIIYSYVLLNIRRVGVSLKMVMEWEKSGLALESLWGKLETSQTQLPPLRASQYCTCFVLENGW